MPRAASAARSGSSSRRLAAFERFEESPPPALNEELWQYSRISDLDLDRYLPSGSAAVSGPPPVLEAGAWPDSVALLERVGERSGLAVVVDGVPVSCELTAAACATGTRLASILSDGDGTAVLDRVTELNSETGKEEHAPDVFDHLADAFLRDALFVSVPARARIEHPIVIVHLLGSLRAAEKAQASFDRTVIELGEAAEASVIELFASGEGPLLVVPVVDILVGDAAVLSYNAIQQLGSQAWQLGHRADPRRPRRHGSHLHGLPRRASTHAFAPSRSSPARAGRAELLAAYLGDGTQVHDFRTLQEHGAPRTTSDLVFKGAVAGTARSVYSGLIRMRRGAKGADRLPDEPEPRARRRCPRGLGPEPRHRGERRPLLACLGRGPDRPRAALLPRVAGRAAGGGRTADPARLLRGPLGTRRHSGRPRLILRPPWPHASTASPVWRWSDEDPALCDR